MNLHFVGKISFAVAGVFAVSAANAALLDFTIPTSGFATEGYSAVAGTDPSAAITANQITGEAGFKTIRLDVDGENLDIYLDDILGGNPYFDADDGGSPGGLGSCRTLNANAQCVPNDDDNLTISANESLRMYFWNDMTAAQNAYFGEFVFRDDNHQLFDGTVQVSHDDGSSLIAIVNGIADFSIIGGSTFLTFNDQPGSTDNYYISQANITAVPVPAAVWLFGSALGLLGWQKRRTVKA